jgi:hypothetical protein
MKLKDKFSNIAWLENIGNEPILSNENGIDILRCSKIEDMYNSSTSAKWQNFNLDIRNNLTSYVRTNMQEEYKNWNKIAEEIRGLFEEIKPAIELKIKEKNLNNEILMSIRSHFIAMAQEFYYLNNPNDKKDTYFSTLFKIYKNGNFPCGWTGKPIGSVNYTEIKFDDGAILIW